MLRSWTDSRTLALIPRAIAINLAVGQVVALIKLPVYLDAVGTVLVGSLSGPVAGAVTGALSSCLAGVITNPTLLPFALVAAVVGVLAGWMAWFGAFRRFWTAIASGLVCGVVAAACSAPINYALFGGVTGQGTDVLVAFFRYHGSSVFMSAFGQALAADPIDKALTFFIVAWVLQCSPGRLLDQYPRGLRAVGRQSE